ncbi:hypothetical protein OVA13_06685 [Pseudoxanthomonas sp. SL93]|uniref:hypothetical protein n=1 Tax=Pseudoxanthomonas sp. SL93 TaxID=2995142 RepID=UPI00226F9113|nr:hypothetical protein [Pseudoxanthomonas sp. SL93]WAC64445.1 hypothetical protein OVA13_06685 [Pseudoxanthomonas sp. SL93]
MSHRCRLAVILALLFGLPAAAQVPESPTSVPADPASSPPQIDPNLYWRDAKKLEADAPAIPVFYGQSYEGRLSLDNGTKIGYRKESTFKYVPAPHPVAYFYLDMYEKEMLTFGLWTDSVNGVQVNVTYEKTDRKGNRTWEVEGGDFYAYSNKYRCITTIQAGKTRRYRFEIFPQDIDEVANYKFFILPKPVMAQCDNKGLPPEVAAYFDAPGKPATLALAQSWKDKPFVPTMKAPPVFTPAGTDEARAYAQAKPEALRGFYEALYLDGEHNAVLNFQRLGLAAMEAGAYGEAEWAFDQSLARIEAFYGTTDTAKAARSKWTSEGIKDYKGEPYERVMAYYYRGLLYLREGDYQNARAAFTAGEFQDTLSEAEEFQGDFALMNYLAGWSSYCAGDTGLADEAFTLAERANPAIRRPTTETTLLVADLGRGPVKFGRGMSGRLLTFVEADGNGADETASASIGSAKNRQSLALSEYSNLAFQATTRGGRAFDAILDGKASLQNGMRNTAEVGYLMTQSGVLPLQVAGMLVTLVSGGMGGQVKPDADVRVWDTLPHHVAVGMTMQKAATPVAFTFQGEHAMAQGTPVMQAQAGKCGIAWSRSRSPLQAGPGGPGNDADIVAARAKREDAMARDATFRAGLRDPASAMSSGATAP